MTGPREASLDVYLNAPEALLVVRSGADNTRTLYLAFDRDGRITAFNGHVDLGTGIRTALAQIVAEELDVPFERVTMVLGTTTVAPDQGPTIASETIQVAAIPLRQAAATARRHFLEKAAALHGLDPADLMIEEGVIRPKADTNWILSFDELVAGQHDRIEIDPAAPLKPVADYRLVGKAQPRNDIAAKATGQWTYVHDVRVPGMLHGRVVRPPYSGFDSGDFVGNSLIDVDRESIGHLPGIVAVVVDGDFIGIVATREEFAAQAARELKATWCALPEIGDLNEPEEPLRLNRSTPRVLRDEGDVERALGAASPLMERTYVWPYQMHASIGPSCAVADWRPDRLVVWSGTQNPFPMRRDLALLLGMPESAVIVERMEAAGCYGRNCADDVTADAALLSRAVGKPVRVQLTREQEHAWEPKGAAQVIDVRGGLDLDGGPVGYDFDTRYPSNLAPTLALILTGRVPNSPNVAEMGDRTAIPPYAFGNMRVTVHDMPPIARASWFRGVSAMPNSFAHESFIDELAAAAGVDPVEYRLRYLTDPRAADLVRAVTEKAGWTPRTRPGTAGGEGDLLYGRGFAYAVYVHGKFPGVAAAWSAWVADVAVNRKTGEIAVTKITVGQDSGLMINPDGVKHQIHGNVIQSLSRVLKEKVSFDGASVESVEWGGYPIMTFPEVPDIDVLMLPRPDDEPLGVGESASVPSAAAIVNAVYDATGIRFRELPLTPDKILAALREQRGEFLEKPASARSAKRGGWWRVPLALAGIAGAVAGGITLASPIRSAFAPIARPDPGVFSAATIEKGRLIAAAGACNVCHVGVDGTAFAGGRPFQTPFGTVHATNITPDPAKGIGAWSYPAFERAMRQGVSRDGHHLYPVHPYAAFAGVEESDLQALYAYLMTQAPVAMVAPETRLKAPFNMRGLMAGWNSLYLDPKPFAVDPVKSASWNRGAYLVETLGHCSACHTERNVVGAEKRGTAHLAGGFVDGWAAPSINGAGSGPVGWTQTALFDYLRSGHSADHGSAGGPMADVVKSLSALPDEDIAAMADYLTSRGEAVTVEEAAHQKEARMAAADAARSRALDLSPNGARIFEGACASCHESGSPLANLAFNTSLASSRPDNLINAILHGTEAPAVLTAHASAKDLEIMSMPGFSGSLSDRQIGDLLAYLRARFAPEAAGWTDLAATVSRIRAVGAGG
ncbi:MULTISPECIES: molybdopterin cofactor-binding domain-containing protein [Alphaproteobacteria]|uniref:Aldehyde dehydrogenase n=2 Tax=Alphaproteobacteria TaxID=28211 RepID=A0A512HMG3_9HYPH|nr:MULTISPECIES: molybdopterin cofactor-binding domain-containing protein [Alphaproteobacteria]GEO86637.1 aldehyde dehydrogenase [Ciceribacter naphthalenivorans]GLR23633.1 aldehyde dehydrogenase [Ciceribacter naphthalenivorans]GLT06489.1 aldehyde dehydrogenase [Sphingomonas psychrolutea]